MSNAKTYVRMAAVLVMLFSVSVAQAYTYDNFGDAGGWDNILKKSP